MVMQNKSDSFILNKWLADGVPISGAGGASGAAVALPVNVATLGGATPLLTTGGQHVTIKTIAGVTPTLTGGAQHFVLTGASTTDGHYLGDIKFGEALPAGAAHIGEVGIHTIGGATPLLTTGAQHITVKTIAGVTPTLTGGAQHFVLTGASTTDGHYLGDVVVSTIDAGETHIGEIGRSRIVTTVTLTAGTTAYSVADLFADTQPIANAMRVAGGKGTLESITVVDRDDQAANMDLVFLDAQGTLGTENSAVTVADAVAQTILGVVQVNSWFNLANSQIGTETGVNLAVQAASGTTSLWVAAVTRGTPTLTTVDSVILKLGWERD